MFTFQSNGQTVTVAGYDAGSGWGPTTGVGTPKVAGIAPLLFELLADELQSGESITILI